jgi:hypothetical protein
MATQAQGEIVPDPVGHISISGVHGRSELDQRRRHFEPHPPRLSDAPALARENLTPLLIGAAIGAALLYLLKRR